MENILTVLNAVKNYNEISNLKSQVRDSSKKSEEYLKSCKRIIAQNQAIHKKEIEQRENKIKLLSKEIEKQNEIIKKLEDENARNKTIINSIPRCIISLFSKRGKKFEK